MTKKEKLLNAADKLDEARERMNHGGKHWVKGALKRYVRKDHTPGETGFSSKRQAGPDFEAAYCSVGALQSVRAPGLSHSALGHVINEKKGETIISFNDAKETRWADVSRMFRTAAGRLRREAEKL